MERQVCVASYLNSSEAELARVRLAQEDIPAFLENAGLVLWGWYYSNAVGGVKVFVPESEADRAWAILHPSDEPEGELFSPSESPTREEDGEADSTGGDETAHPDQTRAADLIMPPAESEFPLKCSPPVMAAIICGSGLVVLLSTRDAPSMLAIWAFIVVLILTMRSVWTADEDDSTPPEDQPDQNETGADDESDAYEEIEAAVGRAWKAAVLSLAFMPLAIYSLWILMCTFWFTESDEESSPPLRPREIRRIYVALAISIIELLLSAGLFLSWYWDWYMWS